MGGDDKTESATPRKRGEARKKGNVAKSTELSSILVLFALLLAMRGIFTGASTILQTYLTYTISHMDTSGLTSATVMRLGGQAFLAVIKSVGPLLGIAMVVGVLANIAQTGPLWAPESLRFDPNRMNPLTGLKRLVSGQAVMNLAKSSYKIGLIAYIAFTTIRSNYAKLVIMTRMDLMEGASLVGDVMYQLALRVVTAMLVMAALDYAYQRWQFEKSLRMSKDEVKQEYKQMEGSPLLKSRIRARQREIAKRQMLSEVMSSTVVVTNPTHFAVALRYDADKHSAPQVVAKGADLMAFKIRELAQANDIPIVENVPLARALFKQVDVGREIPGDLYEAVAEVLAFVFQINQKRRERSGVRL